MVNNASTTQNAPSPSTDAASDEEPLLYVNARQYKRILKRRAARARLHELGKIPKERPVSIVDIKIEYCGLKDRYKYLRMDPGVL